jgi:hypothetical protein
MAEQSFPIGGKMRFIKDGRTKIMTTLVMLAIAANFISSGCGIKKPQAPTWLTTWDIPLISRVMSISEILDHFDSPNIIINGDGNPGIEFRQQIDTVTIDNCLSLDATSVNVKDSIGVVEIEPARTVNATTYLDDVIPVHAGFLPPCPFIFNQPLEPFDKFSWATIERGALNVTLYNALEVNLDTLIVSVIDSSDMHLLGVLHFDNGLSYLESETQSIDISGQTISNVLFLAYHGHTPGGVLVNAGGQYLDVVTSFSDTISVSAARAEIPQIDLDQMGTYEINDSTKVYSSLISTGTLHFAVTNGSEIPFDVILSSPNFVRRGQPLQISRHLTGHSLTNFDVDISSYTFTPNDNPDLQTVSVEMINSVPPSAPVEYTFHSTDSLSAHVDISEITFESLRGRIKPYTVHIAPVSHAIDLPDGLNRVQLTQGYLTLALSNNSMIPAHVDITITGGAHPINISGDVTPKLSQSAPAAVTTLSATPEQTSQFFNPAPNQMTVSAEAVLNPGYGIAEVTRYDNFFGEMTFTSAFAFAISDTVMTRPEISHISLNSRPDNFGDKLRFGKLNVALENHLPIGTIITIFLGLSGDSTLYSSQGTQQLGPYYLQPAQIDSLGHVTQPALFNLRDSLDNEQLSVFDNDSIFIGQQIKLLPTTGSGVTIMGSDYLGVRAGAKLQVKIGDD